MTDFKIIKKKERNNVSRADLFVKFVKSDMLYCEQLAAHSSYMDKILVKTTRNVFDSIIYRCHGLPQVLAINSTLFIIDLIKLFG